LQTAHRIRALNIMAASLQLTDGIGTETGFQLQLVWQPLMTVYYTKLTLPTSELE